MKKSSIFLILLAAAALMAIPYLRRENTPRENGEAAVQTSKVEIQDFAFSPAAIRVRKGTTVMWTNRDAVAHTVTGDRESSGPASEAFSQGATYTLTFNDVGTFPYHCTPHPNMRGSVEVVE